MAIKLTEMNLLTRHPQAKAHTISAAAITTPPAFIMAEARALKIASLRRAIQSGNYEIDSQRLARKLLGRENEIFGLWT